MRRTRYTQPNPTILVSTSPYKKLVLSCSTSSKNPPLKPHGTHTKWHHLTSVLHPEQHPWRNNYRKDFFFIVLSANTTPSCTTNCSSSIWEKICTIQITEHSPSLLTPAEHTLHGTLHTIGQRSHDNIRMATKQNKVHSSLQFWDQILIFRTPKPTTKFAAGESQITKGLTEYRTQIGRRQ
jgi:hypothetical protein